MHLGGLHLDGTPSVLCALFRDPSMSFQATMDGKWFRTTSGSFYPDLFHDVPPTHELNHALK